MSQGTQVKVTLNDLGDVVLLDKGGFHLIDLFITELKAHMTCYEFESSHWLKIYL
jgi:hypothetical protein